MRTSPYDQAALREGLVYPKFYGSLFADLRDAMTKTTRHARADGKERHAGRRPRNAPRLDHRRCGHLPKLSRRLSDFLVATGSIGGFDPAMEANREPVLDLITSNFAHFDTVIEQDGDVVRLTRLPEEIVFDPIPTRETASLGDMLEMEALGGSIRDL